MNPQIATVTQIESEARPTKGSALTKNPYSNSRKRSSLDVIADILTVSLDTCGSTQLMSCANLSFKECRKYISILEMTGLIETLQTSGSRARYSITQKGREYLRDFFSNFGTIAEGERTVWSSKSRSLENPLSATIIR